MSRGARLAVAGNLSISMRDNYGEHGVDEYYRKVGSSYRNPHYPGVRLCMFSWLNRWWQMVKGELAGVQDGQKVLLFDLACGSGEVTIAFAEWLKAGRSLFLDSNTISPATTDTIPVVPQRKSKFTITAISTEFPRPYIVAADPFTSEAFSQRTGLPCDTLSFKDVTEGAMPFSVTDLSRRNAPNTLANEAQPQSPPPSSENMQLEMVVCSFALHLIENPSELFALLWELSTKARWLVVIAPHKKPEIKDGWGWLKWNPDKWAECPMTESKGEYLHDRVHCRVYRSVNL
ncbi:hypothetical protein AMATHDRAFT_136536 [Amanita thiersii Skay4041]|uniref:Methyltransferase domain-containing protein n=1 Tax=Amanita thiersii Skay4041 TaxID=703135 RepID=A0A2A9NSA4_9AGAR|nr:hypothetical protein AMATHDRAFT_136536 [Amanita thiersii Skay4041]